MTVAQFGLFWFTDLMALRIGGFFIGIAFGWHASTMVVLFKNLWGLKYLAGNYALFDSPNAFGGLIMSTWIFASIYEHFAEEEEGDIQYFKGTKCYGADCYKWTFLVSSGSTAVALIMAIVYWWCTPRKQIQSV